MGYGNGIQIYIYKAQETVTAKRPKIVATIECRMTSSRLPGKVLMAAYKDISMLELMIERVKRTKALDDIVIATTTNKDDDPLVNLAQKLQVSYFRGSEPDVLERVYQAHKQFQSDIVVELTGDCPLVDPDIISQTIDLYLLNDCDYTSTGTPLPHFPIGMDTQVFSFKALEKAYKFGTSENDREHVSYFISHNRDRFRLIDLPAPPKLKNTGISLTLDTKSDYELIRTVIERLYPIDSAFNSYDIVNLFDSDPQLPRVDYGKN